MSFGDLREISTFERFETYHRGNSLCLQHGQTKLQEATERDGTCHLQTQHGSPGRTEQATEILQEQATEMAHRELGM